ncbi:Transmembrane protein [Salix suchowensis]|nr:Transmembrane protein [Salix suchowensis]
MGIMAKAKSSKNSSENWGMGLLLVFFPEDTSSATTAADATVPFCPSPSSTSSLATESPNCNSSKIIKRTNSNNPIITKTQSTISICALLLFLSLLLFTLSTFEPAIPNPSTTIINKTPRRFEKFRSLFALQGMGKLYRRGTRAMSDLVVAHVIEETNEAEFRLFLRVLHRSGLTARADVVFVFPSSLFATKFESLIQEENESFWKLVNYYRQLNRTSHDSQMGEPLWGKRIRVDGNGNSSESGEGEGELNLLSYGSVVGFEASELDPENSLAGFLDHVPMSLRRWACYPMLLGRVRRNFKHLMLVDVKKVVFLRDPLGRVRNRSPESVYIRIKQESCSNKHGRKNSEKTQSNCQVNSAMLMGGTRGIRRLSSAMLTEIARAAMQHKKKGSVTESGILTQLVGKVHMLKNIDLITSTESIPGMSSLTVSNSSLWNNFSIIQLGGNGNGNGNYDMINSIIIKQICSWEVESSVYRDC